MTSLTILHVDMDAFYASVEQRDRPELRGLPVIVGGIAERGVVAAASYESRRFGVHSAMSMALARRLCPQGVFLPPRFGVYAAVSQQIRSILQDFTPIVEPLSLDEAFLDVRGCEGLFGPAPSIAKQIKQRIRIETQLIASVGVAPNKFLAKLGGDIGKPDGLVVIEPGSEKAFLAPLPIGRLWGVGARTEKRLQALGLRTVGDLAALSVSVLKQQFGENGEHLWQLANGIDARAVVSDHQAKSISTETTFRRDIDDRQVLRDWLLGLVDHLGTRLRREEVRARTVDVKIRSSDFRTVTRSQTLPVPTDVTAELWKALSVLFERSLTSEMLPVRLLGVGGSNLLREGLVQGDLFDGGQREKQSKIDRAMDAIRGQFGKASIRRGSLIRESKDDESSG